MSNEVTIQSSLKVVSGTSEYVSRPTGFTGDIVGHSGTGGLGAIGPSPGAFVASGSGTGTVPGLTQLSPPGYYRVQNLSNQYTVDVGLVVSGVFYAKEEILPGETYTGRFSVNLDTAKLSFKGQGGHSIECLLEAFQA